MELTSRVVLSIQAAVTSSTDLADTNTPFNIGFINENLSSLFPTGVDKPDIVYANSFTLGSGLTKSVNMTTAQITTIDATQPKNLDGETFALTKIFAMAIRLAAASNEAVAHGIKFADDTWTRDCVISIDQIGGMAVFVWPEGAAVAAAVTANFIETGGAGSSVDVDWLIIGKE